MFASILNTFFLAIVPHIVSATNTSFYGAAFLPHTPILRFEVDVVIPSYPPNVTGNSLISFWPGLQPEPVTALLQNVITDDGLDIFGGIQQNEWWFLPFWCCNPAKDLSTHMRVYPGDLVKSIFLWTSSSHIWYDSWAVIPNAGQPFGGSLLEDGHFDATYANNSFNPMMQALLNIEVQNAGAWNFGTLGWKNLIIEAAGNETDWCLGKNSPQVDPRLQWNESAPTALYNAPANTTTCYIASIQFNGWS